MNESLIRERKFNWSLSLYAAVGAVIVYLLFALFGSADAGMLLFILLAVIICLALLAIAVLSKGKRRLSIFSMLVVYLIFSAILIVNNSVVRDITRWIAWSESYKTAVRKTDPKRDGELQHVKWDSWGWAGGYTDAYVVFDPSDSLAATMQNFPAGEINGIPCKVYRIHRLEKYWYAATFYTDDVWDQCIKNAAS